MSDYCIVEMRDYSNVEVFKTAAVYPVVFRLIKCDQNRNVDMKVMETFSEILNQNIVDMDIFYKDVDWVKYFNSSNDLLRLIEKIESYTLLKEIATVMVRQL